MKRHTLSFIAAAIAFVAISLEASSIHNIRTTLNGSFDPVIELYNKSQDSIQVNIIDISGPVERTITTAYVSSNQQWNSGTRVINIHNKLLIELLKQNKLIARFEVNAPGKTKYMSIDLTRTPALCPQVGPFIELEVKTKSGLSLRNNVKPSEIVQIK